MLAGAATVAKLPFAACARPPSPPGPMQARAAIEADVIVVNGVVYTMDATVPRAEAFAVKSGRFLAIGSTADIRNVATARTQVIDAQGATVLPGFIDTHCHPSGINELFEVNANVRTVAELQANLKKKARRRPRASG
jgi:predicted amidohydrolase YtcJ